MSRPGWRSSSPTSCACRRRSCADDAFPALDFASLGYEVVPPRRGTVERRRHRQSGGLDDVAAGSGRRRPRCRGPPADGALRRRPRHRRSTCPTGAPLDDDALPVQADAGWPACRPCWPSASSRPSTGRPLRRLQHRPRRPRRLRPGGYVGATHASAARASGLRRLRDWGLVDVFRQRYEGGGLFSWWDYRAGNFHKGKGMRIDLVLATPSLAERAGAVLIDRNARKGEKPSRPRAGGRGLRHRADRAAGDVGRGPRDGRANAGGRSRPTTSRRASASSGAWRIGCAR